MDFCSPQCATQRSLTGRQWAELKKLWAQEAAEAAAAKAAPEVKAPAKAKADAGPAKKTVTQKRS